jgi:hypothetical protein
LTPNALINKQKSSLWNTKLVIIDRFSCIIITCSSYELFCAKFVELNQQYPSVPVYMV